MAEPLPSRLHQKLDKSTAKLILLLLFTVCNSYDPIVPSLRLSEIPDDQGSEPKQVAADGIGAYAALAAPAACLPQVQPQRCEHVVRRGNITLGFNTLESTDPFFLSCISASVFHNSKPIAHNP